MMKIIYRWTIGTLVVLALTPAALLSQQPAAPDQLPAEAQSLLADLQAVESRLVSVQQAALEDSELQEAQNELGEKIQLAMAEIDPSVPQNLERLANLSAEAEAAQAEQDQERMMEIVAEAQQIEQALQGAQTEAIQIPEIAAQVSGFEAEVEAKMLELDPETDALIQRMTELNERLSAILGP
ncbi:MAG: hypothetical protein WD766_01200 [Gemmatimonadota bacterium]